MSKEYIDREAAEKVAAKYGCTNGATVGIHSGIADCIAFEIAKLPAAEVVPVVRCKDCKFWDLGDCYRLELSRPDDFCSYGERKAE